VGVIVLLTILNWFIHKFYWTDWMSNIHKRKKRGLLSAESAQFLALLMVGFTSIYREGFETVLFSQVLVLEAGPLVVLQGLALGGLVVAVIGLIAWRLHHKLPYLKLLWVSALLIGSVLLQMVGQTVHVMQAVRWLPVTSLNLPVPYWMGVWFGVYPTVEGLLAQFGALTFVVGSYFLAERQNRKAREGGGRLVVMSH
jgi:high-affinity iron transporter